MFEEDVERRIASIQFGLLSPEEIKRGSVCHVIFPETVEGGIPKEQGLIDLRMGTVQKTLPCNTCGLSSAECVGHFGHIELTKPMFHIGYLNKIKKILECVCFYCSKIKGTKRNLTKGLESVWDALKGKIVCEGELGPEGRTGCMNKQPIIKKDGLNLYAFMKGEDAEGKVLLNGERVYNIFKKISSEDVDLLGFSKEHCSPEWLLLTVVLVPPPAVRPSVLMSGMMRGEDDLTHKLADIVKANALLKKYEQEGAPGHIVRNYEQLLQFHLATLVNNDIGGQPQALQKSGRPLKSLSARLKGKEGRVRGNLMGKRVDFSARSVITPDSMIGVEEVGVPEEVAVVHTFPEKVTEYNLGELQTLVSRGPVYPGANYVVRTDGQRIDLRYNTDIVLTPGCIVERHMRTGDPVLFNRQPSLHRMSMMGHRARVMSGRSFRLNLSVTSPYNADFDGDEMNLHMPQSPQSTTELEILAGVRRNIVSPQSHQPVIKIVQDTLVGLYLLTDSFFNRREASALLYAAKRKLPRPCITSPFPLWTGAQIFSEITPNINYETSKAYIMDGKLMRGVIDKGVIGSQGGLVHIINNDLGAGAAISFLDDVQAVVNHFLMYISAFSVGIGDMVAHVDVRPTIQDAKAEVDNLIQQAKSGSIEKAPGLSVTATFEQKVGAVLNRARDLSGKAAEHALKSRNNMRTMVSAGSKGSMINISQVAACVGQQSVEGQRIPFGFQGRTLPHFTKFDYSAKARGFVENSYCSGLSPHEFFFHAMGGREGLIDTAIKTAETGYIQRRLVKAMEDATVQHDLSVRGSNGQIYQCLYGDDSFDSTKLEFVDLKPTFIDLSVIKPEDVTDEVYRVCCMDDELHERVAKENEYFEMCLTNLKYSSFDEEISKKNEIFNKILENDCEAIQDTGDLERYSAPFNTKRIVAPFISSSNRCNISPHRVFSILDSLMTVNPVLNFYIRSSLSVQKVLKEYRLNDDSFKQVVNIIKERINESKISPFEMVGTIAAQSVGEPATQMTLNTFHLAGVTSTVSMGVGRLNEVINVARNIKTPSMKVFLKVQTQDEAYLIQNRIELLSLKQLCTESAIYYDPDIFSTNIESDREFVSEYFEFPDTAIDYNLLSPFIIRICLSRSAMVAKGFSVSSIAEKLQSLNMHSHVLASDDNALNPVIRIRLSNVMDISHLRTVLSDLMRTHLQGYEGIKKAYLSDQNGEFFLQTDGINMTLLSDDDIDMTRTCCNDLPIVASALGIEAVRSCILKELLMVIEGNGSYVNSRHIGLLADIMTMTGRLCGITRHGVNREGAGALKRASFEQTVEILLDAAVDAEKNENGITENIMLGQVAPLGTGACELFLDIKKLDKGIAVTYSKMETAGGETYEDSQVFSRTIPGVQSRDLGFSPMSSFLPSYAPVSPGHPLRSYRPNMSYRPTSTAALSGAYTPANLKSPSYSVFSSAYEANISSYSPTLSSYSPTSPNASPHSTMFSPLPKSEDDDSE